MADLGGVPGQVVSELKGVVTDAGKGIVQAGKDIAKGTAETIVTMRPSSTATQAHSDVVTQADGRQAARRRLAEVRAELEEYLKKKKAEEKQIEQIEKQQKMEQVQMKESKRKQEERQILGRLSRQYGGTGEIGKSGY